MIFCGPDWNPTDYIYIDVNTISWRSQGKKKQNKRIEIIYSDLEINN